MQPGRSTTSSSRISPLIVCWWWKSTRPAATGLLIRRTSTTFTTRRAKWIWTRSTSTKFRSPKGLRSRRVYTRDGRRDETLTVRDNEVGADSRWLSSGGGGARLRLLLPERARRLGTIHGRFATIRIMPGCAEHGTRKIRGCRWFDRITITSRHRLTTWTSRFWAGLGTISIPRNRMYRFRRCGDSRDIWADRAPIWRSAWRAWERKVGIVASSGQRQPQRVPDSNF